MDTNSLPETFDAEPLRPTYERREKNGKITSGAEDRCEFCNRPMAPYTAGHAAQIHLDSSTGDYFRVDLPLDDDPRSQGWFSIGSDCAKKIPREYVSFPEKA